jgi:hypothetical protein
MKNSTLSSAGGVISAVIASLCCIGPVALGLVGIGSIGAFSVFEFYRPYLIGFTIAILALAFYFTYRKREVKCEDGTCRVESAGKWNKMTVWLATGLSALAILFPYTGFTAISASTSSVNDTSTPVALRVSFFNVPLVCNAAPLIGCGSRAKFVMLDLMKDSTVKEAWLNRRGTAMAVVWNGAPSETARQSVLRSVFSKHDLAIEPTAEQDLAPIVEDFKSRDRWYKGSDVDALSVQEAGVIADRLLTVVSRHAKFTKYEDRLAFREEVKTTVQDHFLSIKSFAELDASNNMQREIFAIAIRYLGKENLPDPQVLREEYSALRDQDEACCSDSTQGATCCAKDRKGK